MWIGANNNDHLWLLRAQTSKFMQCLNHLQLDPYSVLVNEDVDIVYFEEGSSEHSHSMGVNSGYLQMSK